MTAGAGFSGPALTFADIKMKFYISTLAAVLMLAILSASTPISTLKYSCGELTLHESRNIPGGFSRLRSALEDEILNFRIALTQSNVSGLRERFLAISAPNDISYRNFMTQAEIDDYVKPPNITSSLIKEFLSEWDVPYKYLTSAEDWLEIYLPVSKASEMFNTTFHVFQHDQTGTSGIRALSYSIPQHLKSHIDVIHPMISFDFVREKRFASTRIQNVGNGVIAREIDLQEGPSGCQKIILPSCLQDLYSIPATPATQASNSLLVAGFGDEYAQKTDLSDFLMQTRPDLSPNTTFTTILRNGGTDPQGPNLAGQEANLDIQYTVGMASGVPVQFLSEGDDDILGLSDIGTFVQTLDMPPTVVSISYSFDERDLSTSIMRRICDDFMQVGVRGISLIFSSGDGGVAGSNTGTSCGHFVPTFPATCPYVTSVGSTEGVIKTGADLSGGGFSNMFNRSEASYQDSEVDAYVRALDGKYDNLFNAAGRAFPDVSLAGLNFGVISGGTGFLVNGTSASVPVFSSMIALLNDHLISAGKAPLGFLNPLLYSNPSIFLDITTGNNPGCGTAGFPALAGWDPVTGLGEPDFARMLDAVGL